MMHIRRFASVSALVAAATALVGCIASGFSTFVTLVLIVAITAAASDTNAKPDDPLKKRKAKKIKLKDKSDVELSGSFGGLSGGYDIDVGDYGTLEGVADIKGSFRARLRDKDLDEDVAVVIEAALLDRLDLDVDITKTKLKYDGRQTRGGVKKIFKGNVKYEGIVLSGEHAGSTVKGKMSAKGKFE